MGCCNPLACYWGSLDFEGDVEAEGISMQRSVTGQTTDDTDEDSEARDSRKTASRCWTPLPDTFVCLGLHLEGVVRLFFALQTLHGLAVLSLHAPLLLSRGPVPSWATPKNAFHDLQDLQAGLSLRREQRWDDELLSATRVEEDPADPVLVAEFSIGCALVIGSLAMQAALLRRCRRRDGRARCAECAWLLLTSLHILAGAVLGLAKAGSACSFEEVAKASGDRVSRLRQGTSAYPQFSSDCGTLRLWLVQWTCMVALLSGMGLLACWSYFNVRVQDATRSLERDHPHPSRRHSP